MGGAWDEGVSVGVSVGGLTCAVDGMQDETGVC